MKLALYQGPSPAGGTEYATEKVKKMVSATDAAGAELVVFPELFFPGYNQPDLIRELAQPRDGDWERTIKDIASSSSCAVAFGWAEKDGDNIFNTASVIGLDGTVLARHRKLQLFSETEQGLFDVGQDYTHFELGGLQIGVLICYDIEFAHHSRALAGLGVKLIIVPTANGDAYPTVPMVLVPARALENGIAVAYANYCGTEGNLTYSGLSSIVRPDGNTMAMAGRTEALLIVDVQMDKLCDFPGDHVCSLLDACSSQKILFRQQKTLQDRHQNHLLAVQTSLIVVSLIGGSQSEHCHLPHPKKSIVIVLAFLLVSCLIALHEASSVLPLDTRQRTHLTMASFDALFVHLSVILSRL